MFVEDELVVEVDTAESELAIQEIAQAFGLETLESQTIGLLRTNLVRYRIFDGRPVQNLVQAVQNNDRVLSVQPNFYFGLQEPINKRASKSKQLNLQYSLSKLNIPPAHERSRGRNIRVAVIDSGIDTEHPAIKGSVERMFNAFSSQEHHRHKHGTAVAGIIVAKKTLLGVAPAAKLLAIQAFMPGKQGDQQTGTTYRIVKGIDWALDNGARILNLSFAGPEDSLLDRVLDKAYSAGGILIAAAGNKGPKSPPVFPAAHSKVLAVTATDAKDLLYKSANRGRYIGVAAPGVDIIAPTPGKGFVLLSGTSMAAAHVSGLAALMLEINPNLPTKKVYQIIRSTSLDLGPPGRDNLYGNGLVQALRVLSSAN